MFDILCSNEIILKSYVVHTRMLTYITYLSTTKLIIHWKHLRYDNS